MVKLGLRRLCAILVVFHVLFVACASPPRLDAYLTIRPDDGIKLEARFTECSNCPRMIRELPAGRSRTVTISHDPIYSMNVRDIGDVVIYEERSTLVRDTRWYTVIVTPTPEWRTKTQAVRDAYPYDHVAWITRGRLVGLGPNINRWQMGSFGVAAFFCRAQAIQFVSSLGLGLNLYDADRCRL